MKVSYNWLQEYFDDKLPKLEELGELLTFYAFEIEEIEKKGSDYLIDVDVLPNRSSDSMSHRGIAREIATLLNREMKYDPLNGETLEVDESEKFKVEVRDGKLCSRYAIAVIEGVKVKPSPDWLKEKLEVLGHRSINNIVDATNYVMLNTGQPLHAFDVDKLEGEKNKQITIRSAKKGEKITTLTDDEYELDESNLLITDGNSDAPIGIAGVKGGKLAEVDEKTKNIVIESAHFNFVSVRKTAQKLKLWTEASTRFQNNPSQYLVGYGLADVVELILDIAGGAVEGALDVCVPEADKEPVSVTLSQINGLLGTRLIKKEVTDILDRFNFEYEIKGETFIVTPPFERMDINIYEDLIEEVGRMHGYEHLEAKQLPAVDVKPETHKEFYYTDKVKNIFVGAGYSEILGYTFRDSGDFEVISAAASDKAHLRIDLSSGMREYLDRNHKNAPLFGVDRVKLFEIGRVFPKKGEYLSLATGVSGKKSDEILNEAKKLLEKELDIKIPESAKEGVLEINFTKLLESLPEGKTYEPFEQNLTEYKQFSPYPFVLRDIAVWAPSNVKENEINSVVEEQGGELLIRKTLFDQFDKEGKTSYAYHLVFQSHEKTLSDDEVNKIMENITLSLNKKEGFEVR